VSNDSTEGPDSALERVLWRKSTFSGAGECVVFAEVDQVVVLRNSNRPAEGTLFFDRAGLASWVAGCRAGEFDDLTS
jgi:hypothetical protein